ncbi:hypothetical protein ACQEVG_35200 [Streptomyces sp. CA-135486]|uniref:hypothetical protein n=1 Tax=Streptomyces sp. CA-135486 TaxID=3240049 RepID=UPI003D8F7A0C
MPADIEFSDEVRDMLFVLLGDRPLQANSDLAYGSSVPFLDFADRLMDLRNRITDSVSSVQGALPPQVAEQYVQAMSTLTGTNGVDHFEEFIQQLDALAEGQVEQSRKIMESKWEIIAEIIQLLIELAFIAAMAFFTGGLSFGEAALAKSRTRFTVLLILDRLLRSTNLLPAFSEALQEAFTTFAVRLAMLSLNTGDRRPDGIDWGDIGKSAAAGALAGFFIGGLSGAFNKFFKNYFNDFGDNKWAWGGSRMGQEFLSEGIGETGAEFIVNGAYEGKWEWKWDTFLGAGLSAISEFVVMGSVAAGGLFLHNKFFGPQNFSEYNELPDSGGGGGRGSTGSDSATPLPLPRNDLVSGGIDYADSGPNSLATPPPPPTPQPNGVGHGYGTSAPAALHPVPNNPLPVPGPHSATDTVANGAAGSTPLPDLADNPPLPGYGPGLVPSGASGISSAPPPVNRSIPPLGAAGATGSTGSAADVSPVSSPVLPGAVTPPGVFPAPAGSTLPAPVGSQTPSTGPALTTPPVTSPTPSPTWSTSPVPSPAPSPVPSPVPSPAPSPVPSPVPSPAPSPSTVPDTSTAPSSTEGDEPSHSPEDLSLPPTATPHQTTSPAGGTSTPGTSLPSATPAPTPAGSSTSSPDGSSAGQPVPEELPDETPQDIETHAPDRSGVPATTPAHTSADPIRPRTESGPPSTAPATTSAPGTTTHPETTGPAVHHDTSIHTPVPRSQPAMVDPVPDPVRPEQWRPRRQDAPASPLWTERYDPAADPLGPDRTAHTLAGHDTVIRTWIRRIEADDGRWVRNLTLELPVRFGDGFHADQLRQFEHHMRGLLDEHFNHGLVLPRSGDQLHIDVNLVHAPDHPEAIELSATDQPADSDQFHFRMYSDDPALDPSEYDRRRRRNDATALHELMHYTGLKDRMQDDSSLFRRIAGGQVHPVGIMADLDTLPGPAVPLDNVQTIEDVIDSGPVVRDHPRSAPAAIATSSTDPASLLPPTDRFPAHPPSQGKGSDSDSDDGLFSVPLRLRGNVPSSPSEDSDSDDGLFAIGLRQERDVAPSPAGEVISTPEDTGAAGPSVSDEVTFEESVSPSGSRSLRLSEVMPEKDWWQLFIDPRDHERALKYHPEDPGGIYEREQSPGFRQGMVDAYREAMDSSRGVGHRMNSGLYLRLHSLVINYLDKKPGWSGGEPTSFPLRNADLSQDVLEETLGGRQLALDLSTYDWAGPKDVSPITALDRFSKPGQALLQTNYRVGEAPALVDQAFDRYYDEIANSTDELGKLSAIARAVRALQIIHPFHDANRRVNVHLLLHKLLLEQGFSPVVTKDLAKLFQGSYSVPQMAEILAQHTRTLTSPLPPPPASGQTTADPTQPPPPVATTSTPPPNRAPRTALVEELRSRLPGMPADERASELALLSADELESLAVDPTLVDALRTALPPSEFAAAAAQLMMRMSPGVDQPVSARHEMQAQMARMLRDPQVAAELLNRGARVVIVPKSEAMTSLAPFRHLAGQQIGGSDGRTWDTVRGAGGLMSAVTEENLLGELTSLPGGFYPDGYSTTTHEFAHAIHTKALSAADRQVITDVFHDKLSRGHAAAWPDGPLYNTAGRPTYNYSSTNEFEYFAQVSNAYLGTNAGTDAYTGQPRNNGPDWVRQHEPALLPILERLYGTDPVAVHSGQANPVHRTQRENELYDGYRAFWDQVENTHRPQPHDPAPAISTSAAGSTPALPPLAPPPANGSESSDSEDGLFAVPLRAQGNVPSSPSDESDDGLFAVGLRPRPDVVASPAGEVIPAPDMGAAGPSVSDEVTFEESVSPSGSRSLRLSAVMPEKDWWQLFIDPRDHERALEFHPEDPGGIYEREQSPGFRQGMVDAYREAMDSSRGVGHRMNSGLYLRLHSLVIKYLDKKPGWSGGGPTSFPLRNADLSQDVLEETLGGRQLVLDLSTYDWAGPKEVSPITALDRFSKPGQALLQTNYQPGEAPALVDQAFDRYYDEAARSTDDLGKLSAIARAVRALQIIHPFQDANRRVNVHLLLHKLLLEQGFSPVVTKDLAKLFQGSFSVRQMAETLAQHTRPLTTPLPPPPTTRQPGPEPARSPSAPSAPVTASPQSEAGSAGSHADSRPAPGSALSTLLKPSEAAQKPIERQLELRRPPRVDGELPPPALQPQPVHYSDNTQMPALGDSVRSLIPDLPADVASRSTGFGLKDFTLRGTDLALNEIARQLDEVPALRPKPPGGKSPSGTGLLADVATALRDDLDGLVGDGRDFPYTDSKGRPRVLKLRLRPYGQWEKFSDVGGAGPSSLGKVWQTALTTGQTPKVNTSRMFNPMVPLFPVTKPAHVFARLGLRFGQGRSLGYTLNSQATAQVESKVSGASHVHLDDTYYDFSVTDADGNPVTERGSRNGRPRLTGFAVRSGLALRLPDGTTAENKPGRIPRTLEFSSQPDLRLVGTENYGPVAHIRDWAAGQIGAKPGSSAYSELDAFFSARNFQRVAPLLATGRITTPALYGDGKNARPLGVFTVRATSRRALLLTDSVVHALRSQAQLTQTDSRSLTKSNTQEIAPTVGPLLQWMGLNDARLNLRLLIGITGRFGHTSSRASTTGGSGSVQATGVTGDKAATGLYLVQKTIRVQRTGRDRGAPARQNGDKPQYGVQEFTTWSLERIPGSEARRLAGWDDGTSMRSRGGRPDPFPPPYLTENRPPTLGVSRVELFTFSDGQFTHDGPDGPDSSTLLDHFTDRVLAEASRAYPDLVAPFSELDPANPRWRNADHFQLALSNALEVSATLAQTGMAANLEALTTTGLRIDLREHGRLHRGYRYIWLDGELTGRRYEGTDSTRKIEFSAAGGEKLDSELGVSHGADGGIQALITLRGTKANEIGVSMHAGTLTLGGTGGGQRDESSAFGPSVARDIEADSSAPPHLFSYQLSVTASRGGYWRLPGLLRGAISAGLLGTQAFVFREGHRPLIGGPTGEGADGALTGRVLLSVPAEHSSEADPDLPDADHPYRVLTGTVRDRPMHDSDAFQLATGSPAQMRAVAGRIPAPYENHPFQTLIVVGRPELIAAAEAVLQRASGGSWHQTQQGAPGHDAALTVFQSPYLTANSDQSMGPAGYRVSGLWAPGPYLNRSGVLAHRMVLRGLRILAGPAPIALGHTLTGGTQTAGKNTKSLTFSFGGSIVAANTHAVGDGGVLGIGPTLMPWTYTRAIGETLNLSASADVSRSDSGHQVLVSGNADHEVAAASTALGTMSAANSPLVPRSLGGAAGRRVLVPGGWIGHLPEKSAVELGLIQDGFGPVPRYANHLWTPQGWLPTGRFGSYPVNALNTAAVLADFDRQLSRLFARESDRDTVRRLVSGRVVRAMRGEMSGAGASVPARIGRWGWDIGRVGGRQVRVRAELLPGESRFVGIDHSAEFKDSLSATESKSFGISRTRGPQLGLTTTQFAQTGHTAAPLVGPTYSETGSSLVTRSANRSEAAREAWSVKLTDPYAEHVTPYRLRLTLEVEGAQDDTTDGSAHGPVAAAFRGKQRVVQEDGVGELRTHTSLSLTLPAQGATTLLDTPFTPPAPGPVRLAPLPAFTGDANWRAVRHPDGSVKPFVLPEDGFVIRDVIGSAQVREAAGRALAKAYDIRFRDTDSAQTAPRWRGDTPLTRIGTGSAYNLEEGTTGTVLSSFAGKALGLGGHTVPGLIEDSVVGGADGQLTVYCKPHLDRAQLLTVADGVKMEHSRRGTTEGSQSVSGSESASSSVGEVTVVPAGRAGTVAPGAALPGPNAAGSDTLPGGLASTDNTKVEVKGRAFLFSVPASWLTVASVHRHFKDGRIGRALISPLQALAPAHFGNAGQQAYQTDAAILAWVAEDVARELGLIDATNFPERAGKAWDAVKAVSKAWADADKAYWLARREAGTTPYTKFTAAQGQFETAETEHELARTEYDIARRPLVAANTEADAVRGLATSLREQAQTALRQAEAVAERIDAEAREGLAAGPDPDTGPAALEALADLAEARDRFDRDRTRAGQWDAEADRMVAAAREQTAQRRADATARRDAARTQLDAAGGELHRAQTVYEGHQRELAPLLATAEELAGTYHQVRSAADRLTRWHVLHSTPEGRAVLGDLAEPPEVTFTDPQADPEAPTYTKETGENGITTLTSPTGERHTLLDVPADGESFFHALAEGVRHDGPGAAAALAGHPSALRTLLAGRLRDPANADLLDSVAPDERDTFSPAELARASVDLAEDTPERREFDAIGVVPHSTDLSADSRLDLARAQLLRPGAATADTGWDHGAADLLPALAARTFGVPVTVVDDAGRFQTFPPATDTGAPPVVLYLADRHFQAAVRGLVHSGAADASARPAATPAGPVRPAHAAPPWQPPSDAQNTPRFDAASDHLRLTGPDGAEYDLVEAQGDGNRFYTALAAALPAGPATPGRHRPRTSDGIAMAVAASALPSDARLDPQAVFRAGDPGVGDAGLPAATLDTLHGSGGTLPPGTGLDERQTAALIRSQLRSGRRWDPATAALAAQLAAGVLGVRVTLVHEDGSFDSHPAATGPDDLTEVMLYERGGTYLTVLARAAEPTTPAQPQDPAPRDPEPARVQPPLPPPPPAPDTLPHRLAEVAGAGDRFTEALAYALRENAPQVFDSVSALASALGRSGPAADASTTLRRWVSTHITAADVPADIPLLDPSAKLSLGELDAIEVRLPTVQRTQAVLMGGSLTVAEAGLDRMDMFRLLLNRRADWSEAVRPVVATLVADELGIRLAVVRRTVDGSKGVDYFGPLGGVPILLCTTDDGPFFAALWTPPPPPLPPSG